MIKGKWFHTADNTVLNCPSVDYKFNVDTYSMEKRVFGIVSVLGLLASIIVIIFSKNTVIHTIAGSFLGGILSLIVWLFTIRQQDKINYEVANIDMHIALIDKHLEFINVKTNFINPMECEIVQAENDNLPFKFLQLLQLALFLKSDQNLDTSKVELRYSDGKNYKLDEYIRICNKLAENNFMEIATMQNEWKKIVDWNFYTIERHLNDLKKKLYRYKSYIYCGNAPEDYNNKRFKNEE